MSKGNGCESFEEIYNETRGLVGVASMCMLSGAGISSDDMSHIYFSLRLAGEKLDQLFDIHRGKSKEKGEAA